MLHVRLGQFFRHPALSDRIVAQKCGQIQIIRTQFHIFSNCKTIIVIGLQKRLRLVRLPSDQTDMGMHKQIHLIALVNFPEMFDPFERLARPGRKIFFPCFILQISFQDACKFQILRSPVFVPANVFLHDDLIAHRLIRRFQNDLPEIASPMQFLRIDKIFQSVGIADKLFGDDLRMLYV